MLTTAIATLDNLRSAVADASATADRRIFFVHLPKCGGKSINRASQRTIRALPGRRRSRIVSLDEPATNAAADCLDESVWQVRRNVLAYYLSQSDI